MELLAAYFPSLTRATPVLLDLFVYVPHVIFLNEGKAIKNLKTLYPGERFLRIFRFFFI